MSPLPCSSHLTSLPMMSLPLTSSSSPHGLCTLGTIQGMSSSQLGLSMSPSSQTISPPPTIIYPPPTRPRGPCVHLLLVTWGLSPHTPNTNLGTLLSTCLLITPLNGRGTVKGTPFLLMGWTLCTLIGSRHPQATHMGKI